ncbi:alpha-L-fucosidase [Shouchella shacheensis]|uniref:alpha-L-fucosidase n=1 Tax=Shouchella shacheensis TaxID=1649580 RepID=UPI00073FFF45|nr:alpha-L-fucosidase [Shouchella shacheensis]
MEKSEIMYPTDNKLNQPQGVSSRIEQHVNKNIAAWQHLQYGMFIHWGLYSKIAGVWNGKPVTKGYNEQIKMWADISDRDYLEVAKQFSAEKFDPKEICSLAKDAGMKYIVFTTKHHDGFCMFSTTTTDYNIVDSSPFGQDPLKLLAEECRNHGLKLGIYFSLVDWHQGHGFDLNNCNPIPESMEPMIENQLRELLTHYGPLAEVWFDMSSPTLSQSMKFKSIVRELQPEAVVNSRIWNNVGDFRTLGDNEVPSVTLDGAWQTPASIYHSTWGYRSWQERDNVSTKVQELAKSLVSVRANGGNYLLNIGPRGDGSIVEFEANVLRGIGSWLNRHSGACLGLSATQFGKQSWGEVMADNENLFLFVTDWPKSRELTLSGLATDVLQVAENGATSTLQWSHKENNLVITLPEEPIDEVLPVIKVELDGKLRILPERTIAESDGSWTIHPKSLYLRHGYTDQGNYKSVVQTTVRLTAYLSTRTDGKVSLNLEGQAKPDFRYRVQVGNSVQVVTGQKLTESAIGPFTLSTNQVVPLTITRAEPAHAGEELDLIFHSAVLKTLV